MAVGTNALQSEAHTSTATSEVLVRPNVDTLYSRSAIDLSHSDLVLSVPEVPDNRFYVAPFYDLSVASILPDSSTASSSLLTLVSTRYGNNFANVGFTTNSPPGDYLITFAKDDEPGIWMFNETDYRCTRYKGIIEYPTIYGSIMFRILVKNNGTDLGTVHAIQAQLNLTLIDREGDPLAPSLTPALLGNGQLSDAALQLPFNLSITQTTETFQLLAQFSAANPPEDKSDIGHVNAMLIAAGIKDGQDTPPAGIDYEQVSTMIAKEIESLLSNASNRGFDQNGWFDLLSSLSGDFHTHYTARAYIAWFGYLQLVDYEALYPIYHDPTLPSTASTLQLAANESYIMTFSGKPPVNGFWSLTAYNSTNYLVPNGLDRYSLGDRSNLTYADGTAVYADESSGDAFSVLIQPADRAPSANWTDNWLPAPAGGGEFTVNFKCCFQVAV
jgi:hypothetical protein